MNKQAVGLYINFPQDGTKRKWNSMKKDLRIWALMSPLLITTVLLTNGCGSKSAAELAAEAAAAAAAVIAANDAKLTSCIVGSWQFSTTYQTVNPVFNTDGTYVTKKAPISPAINYSYESGTWTISNGSIALIKQKETSGYPTDAATAESSAQSIAAADQTRNESALLCNDTKLGISLVFSGGNESTYEGTWTQIAANKDYKQVDGAFKLAEEEITTYTFNANQTGTIVYTDSDWEDNGIYKATPDIDVYTFKICSWSFSGAVFTYTSVLDTATCPSTNGTQTNNFEMIDGKLVFYPYTKQ